MPEQEHTHTEKDRTSRIQFRTPVQTNSEHVHIRIQKPTQITFSEHHTFCEFSQIWGNILPALQGEYILAKNKPKTRKKNKTLVSFSRSDWRTKLSNSMVRFLFLGAVSKMYSPRGLGNRTPLTMKIRKSWILSIVQCYTHFDMQIWYKKPSQLHLNIAPTCFAGPRGKNNPKTQENVFVQ